MTAGMKAAPLATTPAAVAAATVEALRKGRRTVWVPATLRPVFSVLRHLRRAPSWRTVCRHWADADDPPRFARQASGHLRYRVAWPSS